MQNSVPVVFAIFNCMRETRIPCMYTLRTTHIHTPTIDHGFLLSSNGEISAHIPTIHSVTSQRRRGSGGTGRKRGGGQTQSEKNMNDRKTVVSSDKNI